MYGFKHHVDGEEGLPGNPEPANLVRYTGWALLAGALLAGCFGFSGWLRHGVGFFDALCVVLLVSGVATLIYESEIQSRLGHRGW